MELEKYEFWVDIFQEILYNSSLWRVLLTLAEETDREQDMYNDSKMDFPNDVFPDKKQQGGKMRLVLDGEYQKLCRRIFVK